MEAIPTVAHIAKIMLVVVSHDSSGLVNSVYTASDVARMVIILKHSDVHIVKHIGKQKKTGTIIRVIFAAIVWFSMSSSLQSKDFPFLSAMYVILSP
jgi:hypothetical protein